MPPAATSTPLITDVTRSETPWAEPTSPLARSRRPSGMRMVTRVGIAMLRMLPAMTPTSSSTTNTHSRMLPGSRNSSWSAVRSMASEPRCSVAGAAVDHIIAVFLRW